MPPRGTSPEAILVEIRARLAAGEHFTGSLATGFYRAVHALDPAATEDSLGALPGNRACSSTRPSRVGAVVPGEQCWTSAAAPAGPPAPRPRPWARRAWWWASTPAPSARRGARAHPGGSADHLPARRGERLSGVPDRSVDCAVASMVLEQLGGPGAAPRRGRPRAAPRRPLGGQRHRLRPPAPHRRRPSWGPSSRWWRATPRAPSRPGQPGQHPARAADAAAFKEAGLARRRSRTSSSPWSWRPRRTPGGSSRAPTSPTCSTRRDRRSCGPPSSAACPTPCTCRCASSARAGRG